VSEFVGRGVNTGGRRSDRVLPRSRADHVTDHELAKNAARRLAIIGHALDEPRMVSLTCRYYGISPVGADYLGRLYIRTKGSGGCMGVGRLVDHAVVTGSRGCVAPPRPLLQPVDQRRGR